MTWTYSIIYSGLGQGITWKIEKKGYWGIWHSLVIYPHLQLTMLFTAYVLLSVTVHIILFSLHNLEKKYNCTKLKTKKG